MTPFVARDFYPRQQEVKKMKDHLIMLQDERSLVITCLSNVSLVQERMGDKPIQDQKAIKFLNL